MAKNILIIGDSHTAGPFGQELYKNLSIEYDNVVIMGHSSSAAIHWMKGIYKLSGGVLNKFKTKDNLTFNNSNFTRPTLTPLFTPLLEDMRYHSEWKTSNQSISPDIVIVALGTNDLGANIPSRKKYNELLIDSIINSNKNCVFIHPPKPNYKILTSDSDAQINLKKEKQNQLNKMFEMVQEITAGKCLLVMNGKDFVSPCSDKIHFSCTKGIPLAHEWANRAFNEIKNNF